jgi:cytoplasmic tRNA 2-thiolation protein 2
VKVRVFRRDQRHISHCGPDLPLLNDRKSDVSSASLLKAYLASLPTPTSYQNSISLLIRLLLQYTARTHGCSHLLLGTSLTALSVNLIGAVANGAGYTLAFEKDEDWQSPSSGVVRVVRPLREISMKECAAYLRWRNLSVIGNQRMLLAPTNNKDSIADLTKGSSVAWLPCSIHLIMILAEFIFGLDRDYPSTVSAIVRTCDKLVSNTVGDKCVLCERYPFQHFVGTVSALSCFFGQVGAARYTGMEGANLDSEHGT